MKDVKGTITGLNSLKTARVSVVRQWQHPLYGKSVTRSKTYACQVEDDMKLELGDEVVIRACSPVSKTKRFKVVSKVEEKKI